MMNSRGLWSMHVAAGLAAIVMLGGCTQQKKEEPAPTPAKVEAPKEQPKAAPAPVMAGNSATQYWPTGRRESSAVQVDKIAPVEVAMGQDFEYTLRVTNMAASAIEDVVVSDSMDAGFKFSKSEPAGQLNGSKLTVGLGKMAPGETKTIKVMGSAAGKGVLTNCATVAYALPLCVTTRVVEPALALTKKITPESILNCDVILMNLEVSNSGTGVAKNVHITDNLPAGLTTMDGKSALDIAAGDLAPGSKKPFEVKLKAAKTGKYDNKAMATADGGLKAESATVSTVVKQPVLTIDCKPGSERVVLGRDTTFTFTVKNTGDAACDDTKVVATLPAGTSFKSADNGGTAAGQNVTWSFGALAAGASKTVTVTVASTNAGNVPVSATASCKCAAPATTNCQVNYIGIPAILLECVDDPDPVMVGTETTYTIRITNQGFANLTNVQLIATMDQLMGYVSSSNGTVNGATITFPAIATLAPKASQTFTVKVKANGEGMAQLKVEAKSNEITRPPVETETSNFYK